MVKHFQITIISSEKPRDNELNKELQWFSRTLGLFNERDKESSCFRIFVELVKTAKGGSGLKSDEIAQLAHLTRGTVVHHLNKLIGAGIVASAEEKYILRSPNLKMVIKQVKKDILKTLDNAEIIAEELDVELGL